MLRGQLSSGPSGHANHERNIELAARHMQDRRGVIDDLIEGKQTEIYCHDFHDRTGATHRRANARADECGLGERRVADAFGAELIEQTLAHRETAAVATDVFAHQKNALVTQQRIADRRAHRFSISGFDFFHSHNSTISMRNFLFNVLSSVSNPTFLPIDGGRTGWGCLHTCEIDRALLYSPPVAGEETGGGSE